jgi:hypothetical protein
MRMLISDLNKRFKPNRDRLYHYDNVAVADGSAAKVFFR